MLRGGVGGKLKREDVCILIGGSHHCTAETNTTLYNNYTRIKNKLKNKGLKKKKLRTFGFTPNLLN